MKMNHPIAIVCASIVAVCLCMTPSAAQDWPQWNGPNRDGTTAKTVRIALPEQITPTWVADVGLGYSGPVIQGDRLILTDYELESGTITNNAGKRDKLTGRERITCFNSKTGKQLWQHAYDRPYSVSYPSGPRATPTIFNNRVYALGSEGDLICLEMESGEVVWQVSFSDDFGAKTPLWGHAASPLVHESNLICMVGGEGSLVVALDLNTGEVQWKSLSSADNETGYCPPSIVNAGGTEQLMIWDPTTLHSLDPRNGKEYWSESVAPGYGMSILPPICKGDLLFVSGEKQTSAMFRLASDRPTAELLWRGGPKDALYLATSNAIWKGDYIYGADISSGALMCFEATTGDRKWQSSLPTSGSDRGRGGAHASAFLIDLGNDTLILSETGDLIHAALSPDGYQEISRFHALEPTSKTMGREVVWTYPALAGQNVYVRNDKRLVCFKIAD